VSAPFEYTADAYCGVGGAAWCDWGWCAEPAVEGCVQRFPQADGSIVVSFTPYCEGHGELNRVCIASAARQARQAGQA
jgi:hypothetical protein